MGQSPASEPKVFSVSQEIPCIHKRSPPVRILSQITAVPDY
jgi:hypothetical protein